MQVKIFSFETPSTLISLTQLHFWVNLPFNTVHREAERNGWSSPTTVCLKASHTCHMTRKWRFPVAGDAGGGGSILSFGKYKHNCPSSPLENETCLGRFRVWGGSEDLMNLGHQQQPSHLSCDLQNLHGSELSGRVVPGACFLSVPSLSMADVGPTCPSPKAPL